MKWNPVKELKRLVSLLRPLRTPPWWNPVKELKVDDQVCIQTLYEGVESGEGIESYRPSQDRKRPLLHFVESGEGIERNPEIPRNRPKRKFGVESGEGIE